MFQIGDKVKRSANAWVGVKLEKYPSLANHDVYTVAKYDTSVVYPTLSFEETGSNEWDAAFFELDKVESDEARPEDVAGIAKPASALDKQVSGNHYKDCGIQPIEYIHANGLSYFQGNVVKYVTRYKDKAGKADLLKAIHYLELIIELEYTDE